jgi:hypothetical protein
MDAEDGDEDDEDEIKYDVALCTIASRAHRHSKKSYSGSAMPREECFLPPLVGRNKLIPSIETRRAIESAHCIESVVDMLCDDTLRSLIQFSNKSRRYIGRSINEIIASLCIFATRRVVPHSR